MKPEHKTPASHLDTDCCPTCRSPEVILRTTKKALAAERLYICSRCCQHFKVTPLTGPGALKDGAQ